MFIKKLEIFGFKSFKNKTVLEFDNREVIGIVGPNGCGKSNLVDALLWVMGESSPKHLRGETLSDVIFSGTTKEPLGNISEVNLVLDQGETGFPESYKNFSELMITRRSYRDGKNEYFINQQDCLLKDIREFFLNTGAGCRGFSIIEQESVEKLIAAKPVQRRFIIEEVAGISKFKNRKTESIRKLELVNQNLQRLNDILKIQESQLNQLTNQAKKAEKYKKLKQEIESRKKQIEKREQEELFCTYQDLKKAQDSLKAEKLRKKQEIQALKTRMEKEKNKIKGIKKQIEEKRVSVEETKQSLMDKKMEEASWLDKVKAFELIENIKNKKRVLKEKEQIIRNDLSQAQDFFKDKTSVEELEQEVGQIRIHLNEIQQNKKETEVKSEGLNNQLDFIEKEIKILINEKKGIQKNIQKTINEKNKVGNLFQKHQQASLTLNQGIVDVSEKEKNLECKKQELEIKVNKLNQSVSVLKHKIEEMTKLISQFAAANEGAADLIKWSPEDFQPLFQKLEVESEYAAALGVVLGHYIQALIPRDDTVGIVQAVQRLKSLNKGKTSFLSSLPIMSVPLTLKQEMKTYPAFICFLDEQVKWNIHTEPLKPFLGQTVVVSDLNSAFELKKQFPAFQFVTKEGDLITRDSLVYAGSADKESSLFQIQDQISDCSKDLSVKALELKIKKMELESCIQQLKPMQEEKQDLQNKIIQNAEGLISIKKDRDQMEKDLLRFLDNREKNGQRSKDFDKEKQNLLQYQDVCSKEVQGLEEDLSFKESRLQVVQETIGEYESQNLKKMKWEAELLENRKDQKNMDQEISLLLNLINQSAGFGKTNGEILDHNTVELHFEKEINLVREEKEKLDDCLSSFQKDLEKQSQLREKQEENLKNFEQQTFQMKLDMNKLESDEDKNEMERTYLKNKFQENYQLSIEDFVSSPEEIPLDRLKKEVDRYEEQLNRIKEINFLALEEYEKLSKENFFLNEQKEDLVNSRKEILKVISHIDRLCETRFHNMLEEVNKRFSKVFPIVFQGDGAKAQLLLCEESEDQEPGVDIVIQLPGKKPQSVNLLSRGEKALASICLIYSLFLVKPSPFCIIDEADAPLDDANIFRFLSILKEMSRKSQIIVVTHNKYTMQACRKLYGVTMEQPGITQIVSVDMKNSNFSNFVS